MSIAECKEAAKSAGFSIDQGKAQTEKEYTLVYKGETVADNFFVSVHAEDDDYQTYDENNVAVLLRGSKVLVRAQQVEIGADRPGISYKGYAVKELGTLEGETFKKYEQYVWTDPWKVEYKPEAAVVEAAVVEIVSDFAKALAGRWRTVEGDDFFKDLDIRTGRVDVEREFASQSVLTGMFDGQYYAKKPGDNIGDGLWKIISDMPNGKVILTRNSLLPFEYHFDVDETGKTMTGSCFVLHERSATPPSTRYVLVKEED